MQFGQTFRNLPPVTKNLLLVNILIWLALQFFPISTLTRFENICALHFFTADTFNPAQIITYMFVHESFMHLFFNMFALFMFGLMIERSMGSKRFLFYYLSCGIGAALIQEGIFAIMISHYQSQLPSDLANIIMPYINSGRIPVIPQYSYTINEIAGLVNVPVIGASGAIFGVLLAFGFLYPRRPLYLMFIPVPIQARWFILGYGILELLQGIGNRSGDNVAHFAHLGGMLVGIIMLLIWKRKGLVHGDGF